MIMASYQTGAWVAAQSRLPHADEVERFVSRVWLVESATGVATIDAGDG